MPNQSTLFDAPGVPAGYRLKQLEVFNWGTFHEGSGGQDIWRLVPDGQNTLLTGANVIPGTSKIAAATAIEVINQRTRKRIHIARVLLVCSRKGLPRDFPIRPRREPRWLLRKSGRSGSRI